MRPTFRRNLYKAANWFVSLFSIVTISLMLSEPVEAQRSRTAANPKVIVGEFAPDFELPRLMLKTDESGKNIGVISKDETVKLSSFRGKKPVCLIMSSYT